MLQFSQSNYNISLGSHDSIFPASNCRKQWSGILFLSLIIICGILASGCASTQTGSHYANEAIKLEAQKQQEIAFATFAKRQERVYTVAYPLLAAAAALYPEDAKAGCGLRIHCRKNYTGDYAEIAARHFNLEDLPKVRYVHPQFPAATAGLKPGDKILSINNQPLQGKNDEEAAKIWKDNYQDGSGPVCMSIEREGQTLEIAADRTTYCMYGIQLVNDDAIAALADGSSVLVTSGMLRFTETDDELALVLSHEISHNVLGHRDRNKGAKAVGTFFDILVAMTGINTHGAFRNMASSSKELEQEADYTGLYIAAKAGYNIDNAANIWRRMAIEHPGEIKGNYFNSHPSMPERFIAIEAAVREIKEKQASGLPLVPEKQQKVSRPH